jgi:hypothetical protein
VQHRGRWRRPLSGQQPSLGALRGVSRRAAERLAQSRHPSADAEGTRH